MGLLDDAIREHLELKRRHGANAEEVERQEREALGAARREEFPQEPPEDQPEEPAAVAASEVEPPADEVEAPPEPEAPAAGDEAGAPGYDEDPWLEGERDEVPAEETLEREGEPKSDDVLEDTPEFLQDTPEHDRLWFEQRPPRDFDWDR
jgi:hypothetical protein